MTNSPPPTSPPSADAGASRAVLTEASRQVDIIHTSLAGMTAIVLVLLAAVALPVFGNTPVHQLWAFVIMALAALAGIGGLYYMNYRVHRHVSQQAALTEVLVNSLGQGFLSFDRVGLCGPIYSQACLALLETAPAGQHVADVLRVPADQRESFKDWLDVLSMPNHALGFDDVVKFLPQVFPHTQGYRVTLSYKPVRAKDGSLVQVVVIATDQTEEYAAQKRAQQQQNFADMICRIFKERNQFRATLAHVRAFLEAAEKPDVTRATAAGLLRDLHTLKAAVKHFNLGELGDIVHKLELDLRKEDIASDDQFRSRLSEGRRQIAEALARVKNEVRDLVGHDYEWRGNMHEVEETAIYDFVRELRGHHADPELIRRFLSTIAAVPINDCFRAFERELGDLAEIAGKQVKPVRFTGSNPRVLTLPIQEFLFSLTHVCRNIVDHGIEPSITRLARGKDPAGQVSVHSEILRDSGKEWLQLIIADDGNGIDPSRVRAKLATLDPNGSWHNEDDQKIIQHIFGWGFSTRDDVSEMSGHGVGMEAVEREVRLLGGTIAVQSELYKGTRFEIRIPYVLEFDQLGKSSPAMIAEVAERNLSL
ncbi:MAG TPA: ATP-binding protein [Alphaproteobacteria bacterium]|nr:ATP-binding protein [Alphaproteobacteria bacterium]